MNNNVSIVSRAMFFVSVAITLSMIVLLFLVESSIKKHFSHLDDTTLDSKVTIIKKLSGDIDALQRIIEWDKENPHSNIYVDVVNNNEIIYRGSRNELALDLEKNSDTPIHFFEVDVDSTSLHQHANRKVDFKQGNKSYSVLIYLDPAVHSHFLSDFRIQLLIILICVWMITFVFTYLGIRQGHKQIYAFSKHISTIQAEKLNSSLDPVLYPKELKGLVVSFNLMLSKLNESFIKLSDFSDDVAHELRTPLTNIIMQVQVDLNEDRSLEEYKESLYSILDELERLAKMVNDMLWITRSDKGLISANKERFYAEKELSSVLDYFIYLADEKKLKFNVSNKNCLVFADKSMFRRAISNLISNAIKYSEDNSVIDIYVSSNEKEGFVFEIKNRCENISHDDALKMFDRFYCKKASFYSNDDSIGLGLSIVKSIADVNGGKVWNKINKNHISFYLSFPVNGK